MSTSSLSSRRLVMYTSACWRASIWTTPLLGALFPTRTITTSSYTTVSRWLRSYSQRLNRTQSWSWCQDWHLIRSIRIISVPMLHRLTMQIGSWFPLTFVRVALSIIDTTRNLIRCNWCLDPKRPDEYNPFLKALNRTRGTQILLSLDLTSLSVPNLFHYLCLVDHDYKHSLPLWSYYDPHIISYTLLKLNILFILSSN